MVEISEKRIVLGGRFVATQLLKEQQGVKTFFGADTVTNAAVIIKAIPTALLSTGSRMRLEHLANTLHKVSSPFLAPIIELGQDEDFLVMVQPFVPGISLRERLAQGPLPLAEALTVAHSLLAALNAVHDLSVLHLAVHPGNVIIDNTISTQQATLVGFGAALSRQHDLSMREQLIGTARYTAPEQAGVLDQEVDERSDLYSAGIILFECLVGRPPFVGETVGEVLRQHLAVPAPAVRQLGVAIPRALDEMLQRLLRKEPGERYQSAEAALRDLEEILEALSHGEPDPPLVVGLRDRRRMLAEPAFVGRGGELAAMGLQVSRAASGDGGVVLMEAESGGGKTRLLVELGQQSAQSGAWMLRGGGVEQAAQRPFQVLSGVAAGVLIAARSDPQFAESLWERLGEHRAAVAEALPELADILGVDTAEALGPEQFGEIRSLAALETLLDALGTHDRPVLIMLDDCQWADELSLKLLVQWSQRATQGEDSKARHVLVVTAFRTEEVDESHPLRMVQPIGHLRLPPFSIGDVRRLVESMAGPLPEDAKVVIERLAEGSPFMAGAILRGLVEAGALVSEPGGWRVEPLALEEVQSSRQAGSLLARRLALLPRDVEELLTVGAILGKEFELELAALLANKSVPEAISAVVEARRRHIVWMEQDAARCAFVHDKLRETLLDNLEEEQRRVLHRRAAEAIEAADPARVFELAYHWDAAGEPDKALGFALQAGAQARARYALALAEEQYRIAERGVPSTDPVMQVQIAEEIGDVLMLRGRYEDARQRFEEALALAQSSLARAGLITKLTELAFKRGDTKAAVEEAERGLEQLGQRMPRGSVGLIIHLFKEVFFQVLHTRFPRLFLARKPLEGSEISLMAIRLYRHLARGYYYQGGSIPILWAHLRGMNLAERYPPTEELAHIYADHVGAMTLIPAHSRATSYVEKSLAIRKASGNVWGQGQSLHFYAIVLYSAGRWLEAIDKCREAIRLLERTGDRWELLNARSHITHSRWRLGDIRECLAEAQRLYRGGQEIGDSQARVMGLTYWCKASNGKVPLDLMEEELSHPHENALMAHALLHIEGLRLLLGEGNSKQAVQTIEQAQRVIEKAKLANEYIVPTTLDLVAALRRELEHAPVYAPGYRKELLHRAQAVASKGLKLGRRYQNNLPNALRENGLLAAILGNSKQAKKFLDESLTMAQSRGAKYEYAQTLLARGQVGLALGWPGAAEDLAEAEILLHELTPPVEEERAQERREQITLSLADRFDTILEAGRRLASALSQEAVYAAVDAAAFTLLRSEESCILDVTSLQEEGGDRYAKSLAQRAVEQRRPVIVADAQGEEMDEIIGTVTARSALAAPVYVRGAIAACLYISHRQVAGLFGEEEVRLAEFIATLAGAALENVQGITEIEALHRREQAEEVERALVRQEFQHAADIQNRLLPSVLPAWPGLLEIAVRIRPARETSGDFYDWIALRPLNEDSDRHVPLQLAVGDVAGKGIGAALVMAVACTTLRAVSQPGSLVVGLDGHGNVSGTGDPGANSALLAPSAARTLTVASRLLHQNIGRRDFVACALAVIEPIEDSGDNDIRTRLRLSNAAQVPPLLWQEGVVEELIPPGEQLPLGVLPDAEYDEMVVDLRPGNVVVFASDGLPEAPAQDGLELPLGSQPGELWGFERLAASTARWSGTGGTADAIADGIWQDVNEWCGESSQHDDMTLVVLRVPIESEKPKV